ncbi:MAG: hypothetical protein GY940_40215 [bacterium]|nr:hypothetical protein [bacterium]
MKKIILLLIVFCGMAFNGFSIVPGYYGARSLSLGYGSTGFNYDVNAIFLNPSLLASTQYSLTGYQYQNSFLDYKNFGDDLSEVISYGLANFENLSTGDKTEAFSKLKDLFRSNAGMHGFQTSLPGYVSRGYGLSVSLVDTTVINPIDPLTDGVDLFDKSVDEVTNDDIAGLQMNFLGLSYKQVSLSYGMAMAQSMTVGVTVHYLYGKVNDFNRSILSDVFNVNSKVKDYLKYGWEDAEDKFSKVVADVGVTANLGRFFSVGLVMRNFGNAKITTPEREIQLPRRVIAGLAFRPKPDWGFYLDMDVKAADLLYNGNDIQPISIGIEKAFFQNKFFVRAGMLSDISEENFFGRKSNALYGMGVGFNMGKIVVDMALGLDSNGTVKNLAISGFFMTK